MFDRDELKAILWHDKELIKQNLIIPQRKEEVEVVENDRDRVSTLQIPKKKGRKKRLARERETLKLLLIVPLNDYYYFLECEKH